MKNNQDNLNILIKISKKKNITQRKLANELGFSLGKLNYCINALKQKGLIKIENFKRNKNKINYFYILTAKGITKKLNLTLVFMKKKMLEYEELKNELDKKNGF
jgi:EPS-associated MarR family transcriptional regulator